MTSFLRDAPPPKNNPGSAPVTNSYVMEIIALKQPPILSIHLECLSTLNSLSKTVKRISDLCDQQIVDRSGGRFFRSCDEISTSIMQDPRTTFELHPISETW